jgi:hypothetical protein
MSFSSAAEPPPGRKTLRRGSRPFSAAIHDRRARRREIHFDTKQKSISYLRCNMFTACTTSLSWMRFLLQPSFISLLQE